MWRGGQSVEIRRAAARERMARSRAAESGEE